MGVQVIHSKNASIFSFTRKLFQVRKIVLPKPEKVAKDAILLVHGCGLCECVCARANATKMMHSETKSKRLWWCTIVIPAFFFLFYSYCFSYNFHVPFGRYLTHTHTDTCIVEMHLVRVRGPSAFMRVRSRKAAQVISLYFLIWHLCLWDA